MSWSRATGILLLGLVCLLIAPQLLHLRTVPSAMDVPPPLGSDRVIRGAAVSADGTFALTGLGGWLRHEHPTANLAACSVLEDVCITAESILRAVVPADLEQVGASRATDIVAEMGATLIQPPEPLEVAGHPAAQLVLSLDVTEHTPERSILVHTIVQTPTAYHLFMVTASGSQPDVLRSADPFALVDGFEPRAALPIPFWVQGLLGDARAIEDARFGVAGELPEAFEPDPSLPGVYQVDGLGVTLTLQEASPADPVEASARVASGLGGEPGGIGKAVVRQTPFGDAVERRVLLTRDDGTTWAVQVRVLPGLPVAAAVELPLVLEDALAGPVRKALDTLRPSRIAEP